jgi:large subunit ribosomal protein L24e
MFVRNDAKHFRFCSPKCNKLFKAKKNPRKIKWTKAYRAAHGKELTQDSVLEFEQRRNVPTRYNRDLMVKTIQSMKRVEEIKKRRSDRLFDRRMDKAKGKKKQDIINELCQHVDLIGDEKVKAFIKAKKTIKTNAIIAKQQIEVAILAKKGIGIHAKANLDSDDEDESMKSADSDEEIMPVAIKVPKRAKGGIKKK